MPLSNAPSSFRYYVTSDLHYGVSRRGDRATEALARYVVEHPADGLLLGGDIAKGPSTLRACLRLFANFPGHKLAVPGNHDIWLDDDWNAASSWELHDEHLPQTFAEEGFHPLHLRPYTMGDLAFVGSMGWYDYSFRDDIDVAYHCYETKTPPWAPMPIWSDARYARWPVDDPTLTAQLVERLKAQLRAVSRASQIVGLVHHVIDKSLLIHPRSRVPPEWRFANAFLGSNQLGDTFRAHANVTQVFCGHIHMEREATLDHLRCTTVGGSYRDKQLLLATPTAVLEKRMFVPTPEEG